MSWLDPQRAKLLAFIMSFILEVRGSECNIEFFQQMEKILVRLARTKMRLLKKASQRRLARTVSFSLKLFKKQ